MIRTICMVLAAASWFISCTAANLAAQDAPTSAAEARQALAGFFASLWQPRPEPKQPEWIPLDPKSQTWVDSVLEYWEIRTDKVKTLEFTFQQWDYDPQYIPARVQQLRAQDQLEKMPFAKYSSGVIKYAAPDKGLFRVDRLQVISPGDVKARPSYSPEPKENGQHWIINGKRFIIFDAIRKEVLESQLPPEWEGGALRLVSPFPYWGDLVAFQFPFIGAEALQDRFWIRPLQAEAKGEYCLEFVPKNKQDRANFHSLQIVLDEQDFLPIKMQVFECDWSPTNPHRTAYKFDKYSVNSPQFDARDFTEVKTPAGWRRIVRDVNGNLVR